MASTPPTNEAFLREVDEELRRDELQSLWKRFGRWAIGAVVLVLAAWGGWIFWQDRQTKAAGIEGEQMSKALDDLQSGDQPAAEAALKTLSSSKQEGYRASALMTQASLALQKGDAKGAATKFGAVAADTSIAQPWRDAALVRQTAAEFDSLKPEQVVTQLKGLAVKGSPWFGSAGEMVAIAYLKMGKPELAGKLFADIGKDETVPESIRSRAVQMAGSLGVDAVIPAAKKVSQ